MAPVIDTTSTSSNLTVNVTTQLSTNNVITTMLENDVTTNLVPVTWSAHDVMFTLDPAMVFGDEHVLSMAVYFVLFVVAACGNLTVFITLCRGRCRQQRSRIGLLIIHLAVADMFVTFIMMPLEFAWNITVTWEAGDFTCRALMFGRAFGFYLSSYVLVVISVDRYYAVVKPLSSLQTAGRRRSWGWRGG